MKPGYPRILTINGGSSSIKFALYQTGEPPERKLYGKVDRIGLPGTNQRSLTRPGISRTVAASPPSITSRQRIS